MLRIKYSLQMMTSIITVDELQSISLRNGNSWISEWSTMQSNDGIDIFALMWLQKAVVSNSHCRTSHRKHYAVWPAAFV